MSPIDIQELPRTAVRTWLQAARLPLNVLTNVAGKRDNESWAPSLAFDTFEAGVKRAVGTVLRDDVLLAEGRLVEAKIDELRKAAEIEATAEKAKAKADAAYEQRVTADEKARDAAEKSAQQQAQAEERRLVEQKQRIEAETARKQAQVRKAEQASAKTRDRADRAARTSTIATERDAIVAEKAAVTGEREVLNLTEQLEEAKAIRKAR